MKNKTIAFIACILFLGLTLSETQAQIKVKNNGYVGVATTNPLYRLHVNGVTRASQYYINNVNTRIQEGANNSLRLRTNYGYADIGAQNASWLHMRTDRAAFWFGKRVEVYNHLYPYNTNAYYLGSNGKRWNRAYITSVFRTNEFALSDARSKENIRPIHNAIEIIKQLDGMYYDYKSSVFAPGDDHPTFKNSIGDQEEAGEGEASLKEDTEIEDHDGIDRAQLNADADILRKDKAGFLAQEVQKVLPGAVHYDKEQDTYSMSYDHIIPILVEAIKAQQEEIEWLKSKINK